MRDLGCCSLFGFPGKAGPGLEPLFSRYCGLADFLSLDGVGFISLISHM